MLGTMEVAHELHACDGIRLPFGIACEVLDSHRHDILEQATRLTIARSQRGPAGGGLDPGPRLVTAPLARDGERSATMVMQWIQADTTDEAGGGLAAWLHAHLRLLPRETGGEPVTELLFTARCETTPRQEGFDGELCASFLRAVAAEIKRTAATERSGTNSGKSALVPVPPR